jgi:hypothetical protein
VQLRKLAIGGAVFGVAAVVAAGVAFATIPDSGGVIHGCYVTSANPHKLKVIDSAITPNCPAGYTGLNWNQTGPPGPTGPAGPSHIYLNRNYQDIATASYPGVTVAHLDLGPGTYLIQAHFRYQNNGSTTQAGFCAYQGTGIGGLDASQQIVAPTGPGASKVDGVMLDFVTKRPGDPTDVHVQCYGPSDGSVHIRNTQFSAILPDSLVVQ